MICKNEMSVEYILSIISCSLHPWCFFCSLSVLMPKCYGQQYVDIFGCWGMMLIFLLKRVIIIIDIFLQTRIFPWSLKNIIFMALYMFTNLSLNWKICCFMFVLLWISLFLCLKVLLLVTCVCVVYFWFLYSDETTFFSNIRWIFS